MKKTIAKAVMLLTTDASFFLLASTPFYSGSAFAFYTDTPHQGHEPCKYYLHSHYDSHLQPSRASQ